MMLSLCGQQAERCGAWMRCLLAVLPLALLSNAVPAADAVEAAASCVVIHETSDADAGQSMTCFENIALERSSFESGVFQLQTESQIATAVETTTQFVPYCPKSFSGYCDRLVLGPNVVAPVKIFIYDKSKDVVERAMKNCVAGGGKWTANDEEAG